MLKFQNWITHCTQHFHLEIAINPLASEDCASESVISVINMYELLNCFHFAFKDLDDQVLLDGDGDEDDEDEDEGVEHDDDEDEGEDDDEGEEEEEGEEDKTTPAE